MTPHDYETVSAETTAQPSVCHCTVCQQMCRTCACLGTPSDIAELVHYGHTGDLVATIWMPQGFGPIEMVQLRTTDAGCVKFRDGRCSIHPIKPTEGVLAHHARIGRLFDSATYAVALTWLDPRNRKLITHLIALVTQSKSQPIPL